MAELKICAIKRSLGGPSVPTEHNTWIGEGLHGTPKAGGKVDPDSKGVEGWSKKMRSSGMKYIAGNASDAALFRGIIVAQKPRQKRLPAVVTGSRC